MQITDMLYLMVLITLIVFPQACCVIIIQTDESSLSTLADDPMAYTSDTNQSGRNPEPEAEAWKSLTGSSLKKQLMRTSQCTDNPHRAWSIDVILVMPQLALVNHQTIG